MADKLVSSSVVSRRRNLQMDLYFCKASRGIALDSQSTIKLAQSINMDKWCIRYQAGLSGEATYVNDYGNISPP